MANSRAAFFLLLLVTMVFSSCGIFRKTPTKPPVAEAPPKKEIEVPGPDAPPVPSKPEVIKITYLLPFNTDDIPFDSAGNVTKKLNEQTRISLDYYRGAMMALDTVQKAGVKMKASVYDTRDDSAHVRTLFNNADVQQSHLIIGPVFPAQLQTAAPLARKHKVTMVSPFSTPNEFVSQNPYYILANSPLATHCELLYDFLVKEHKPQRVLLIHNNNETEALYASHFTNREQRMRNGVHIVTLTDSTEVTYNEVEQHLAQDAENIIIVASTNESFVAGQVRKLASLTDNYNIVLYGMPQWRDFRLVNTNTLSKLRTRITAAMWFDKADPEIVSFSERYAKRYGAPATEFALEGYNQTLFFASFMAAKGYNFDKTLPDYTMHTAGESFRFQTMKRDNRHAEPATAPPFDFIENRSVHILEYKGGKAVKIR